MKELAFKFFLYISFSVTYTLLSDLSKTVLEMLISKLQIYHAKLYSKSHSSVLNCTSVKLLQFFCKFFICYVKLLEKKKSCTHLLQVVNQCCAVHIKKETNEWYPQTMWM